jgi:hypothetical protein
VAKPSFEQPSIYDEFMVYADALLARRLEAAEAANARGCTAVHPEAAVLEVAGGCAIFVGAGSPLTHAVGVGLNGAVSRAEICAMEAFFRSRGAKVAIDLCPLAAIGGAGRSWIPAHRADSWDSRDFGPVSADRIIGKVIATLPTGPRRQR